MRGSAVHFEILVEDQSGRKLLEILVPKIIGREHTFRVSAYKGIGRLPKGLRSGEEARRRILLDQLPRLLRGYGRTFAYYPEDTVAVVVVCDLDDKCLKHFRRELLDLLDRCEFKPKTRFCIAVEEGEAWLLGDLSAVKNAYPRAREPVLKAYENDSLCGTWERLADAVYPGGSRALSAAGWQVVGAEKSLWAEKIAPHMNVAENLSPSFCYFCRKIRELLEECSGALG